MDIGIDKSSHSHISYVVNAGVKETVSRDYLMCFVLKTKSVIFWIGADTLKISYLFQI
jgi:hypothetical protein